MASNLGFLLFSNPKLSPNICCCLKNLIKISANRNFCTGGGRGRRIAFASIVLVFSTPAPAPAPAPAISLDLRFIVPDLSPEEAQVRIKIHAQDLLRIKELIDMESWKQVQKLLRESSGFLRQDLYTIIQSKPGKERPHLRKLYSNLFNNVTGLDYAARSKSAKRVQECYQNIVMTLDDIFSRI